jgi:hypothetical protein
MNSRYFFILGRISAVIGGLLALGIVLRLSLSVVQLVLPPTVVGALSTGIVGAAWCAIGSRRR